MDLNEYQIASSRTRNKKEYNVELSEYSLGMVCESGEAGDIIKKHLFHKHELDRDELIKELGDVLWYMANICSVLDIDLTDVATENIEKLKNRYPNGFNSFDSINR